MSKNSPKPQALRHGSDGASVSAELSPSLKGGGGGATATEEALCFKLERVVAGHVSQLRPGFPIRFTEEAEVDIAATHAGKTIGYVPRRYISRIKQILLAPYSAEVQSLSHDSVEVRVTE